LRFTQLLCPPDEKVRIQFGTPPCKIDSGLLVALAGRQVGDQGWATDCTDQCPGWLWPIAWPLADSGHARAGINNWTWFYSWYV